MVVGWLHFRLYVEDAQKSDIGNLIRKLVLCDAKLKMGVPCILPSQEEELKAAKEIYKNELTKKAGLNEEQGKAIDIVVGYASDTLVKNLHQGYSQRFF